MFSLLNSVNLLKERHAVVKLTSGERSICLILFSPIFRLTKFTKFSRPVILLMEFEERFSVCRVEGRTLASKLSEMELFDKSRHTKPLDGTKLKELMLFAERERCVSDGSLFELLKDVRTLPLKSRFVSLGHPLSVNV